MYLLNLILKTIRSTFRMYEGEGGGDGAGDGDGDASSIATGIGDNLQIAEGQQAEDLDLSGDFELTDEIKNYRGSEDVNPNKKELRNFDRTNMTKEDIDNFISVSGDGAFLTDDEIKKRDDKDKGGEGDDKDKKKGGEGEGEEDELDNDTKKFFKDNPEIKKFCDTTSMNIEEFQNLNEKTQEALVNKVYGEEEVPEELTNLKKEHESLKSNHQNILNIPIVKAALEELRSGTSYVAKPENIVTDDFLDKIDGFLQKDDKKTARQEIIKAVKSVIKHERSVHDRDVQIQENFRTVNRVLNDIGKMDKRLFTEETDLRKMTPQHKEYEKYSKGKKLLVNFCEQRGYSAKQLDSMGGKEIYAAFCANQGWDQEAAKKILKEGKDTILKKMRDFKKKTIEDAKSLSQGKKKSVPGSKTDLTGIDRKTLIAEIAKGDAKRYKTLVRAADGNPKMLEMLRDIQQEGMRKNRENKSKKI